MQEYLGSCDCQSIKFSFRSSTATPYMRCYCSICRKVQGGGGYCINLLGDYTSLQYRVSPSVKLTCYQAVINKEAKVEDQKLCGNKRYFCSQCSSNLWCYDEQYKGWFYPFASAIDSDLPKVEGAMEMYCIMVGSKANWCAVSQGNGIKQFEGYPDCSIEEWHNKFCKQG